VFLSINADVSFLGACQSALFHFADVFSLDLLGLFKGHIGQLENDSNAILYSSFVGLYRVYLTFVGLSAVISSFVHSADYSVDELFLRIEQQDSGMGKAPATGAEAAATDGKDAPSADGKGP
jgi:hypothetical protein